MNKHQKALVKFVREHPDTWHPYATDRDSIEIICATANLGIIKLRGDMMMLKSADRADQFLFNR